jgi:hypothetical protein
MAVLSADTTADIEQRQVDAWRRLPSVERLQLVSDTTRAVMDLSLAGIRRRHPQASERECFLRLAASERHQSRPLRHGRNAARRGADG